MPKAPKYSCYAVVKGRDGPKIYDKWVDAEKAIKGFPGNQYKGFTTRAAAQAYIDEEIAKFKPSNMGAKGPTRQSNVSQPTPDVEETETENNWVHEDVQLSDEQNHIVSEVLKGKNVFFTGSAGTGKSVLQQAIIKALRPRLRDQGCPKGALVVTASTGIAAEHIGGSTLHSFAGIGHGKEDTFKLINRIISSKTVRKRWKQVQVLMIDEISMIDGALFDKLETIARHVRGSWVDPPYPDQSRTFTPSTEPFGGIQLVVSGDFFQLPPVRDTDSPSQPLYTFQARTWESCLPLSRSYHLTRVFRQDNEVLASMLNLIRLGEVDASIIKAFTELKRAIENDGGWEATQLFSKNAEVATANIARLAQIPGPEIKYKAFDVPGQDWDGTPITKERATKLMDDKTITLQQVPLKVGAQVMLVLNLQRHKLVNGSIGRVVGFVPALEALERPSALATASESDGRIQYLKRSSRGQNWPVVEFKRKGRANITLAVPPAEFVVANNDGTMKAKREQLPLILAWALSVHKAQGQTLPFVKVDLGSVFENGQAYVALSRATSLETLQVLNFNPAIVRADPRVIAWAKRLEEAGNRRTDP